MIYIDLPELSQRSLDSPKAAPESQGADPSPKAALRLPELSPEVFSIFSWQLLSKRLLLEVVLTWGGQKSFQK